MALKAVIEKEEDLPEHAKDEYKKVKVGTSEVYVLDIEGHNAHPEQKRVVDEAAKTRIKLRTVEQGLAAFGDLRPDEVRTQLERIPELEAAAEGKLDEAKINTIVEGRIKTKIAPLERENANLKVKVGEHENTIKTYEKRDTDRTIREAVTTAARKAKVVDTAVDDAVILAERVFEVQDGAVVTRDNVGVTPGITPESWLEDMQAKRPHWFNVGSGGGGAQPGRGILDFKDNPFTAENWNMTKQGQLVKTNRQMAEKMAKAAGTSIGGPKPAAKK